MKRVSKVAIMLLVGSTLMLASCSKKGAATGSSKRIKSNCGCPHF